MRSYSKLFSLLMTSTMLVSSAAMAATSTDLLDDILASKDTTGSFTMNADDQLLYNGSYPNGTVITNGSTFTIEGSSVNKGSDIYGTITVDSGSLTVDSIGSYANFDANAGTIDVDSYWTANKSGAANSTAQAIYLQGGTLTVKNSVFANTVNEATTGSTFGSDGGALKLTDDSKTSITGSVFYENKAGNGGAISMDNTDVTITDISNSYFIDNQAIDTNINNQMGGAIDINGTIEKISNTYFMGNIAGLGAALFVDTGAQITDLDSSYFTGNIGTNGGAIYNDGDVNSTNTIYKDNAVILSGTLTADDVKGGAIYVGLNGEFNSTGDTFDSNTSEGNAGAVYISGTDTSCSGANCQAKANFGPGTTFINNTADYNGGAIYNDGGILTLTGPNIKFEGNTAALGSAIYNTVDGTVNIANANDTIDLFYDPYTDEPYPANPVVMFDENEDIYNLGTFNIDDSNLQLHGGINTKQSNTDGTVNITNSTIDIGTSTIFADEVNINAGSNIMTHVDADDVATNDKFGSISADKVNISGEDTALTIVVGPSDNFDIGESRTYEIIDSANITSGTGNNGLFDSLTYNYMYSIKDLGDGNYEITRKDEFCNNGKCDTNQSSTADAWLNTNSFYHYGNDTATDIQDKLNELAQLEGCDSEEFRDALTKIAPTVAPLIQSHSTEIARQLSNAVSDRLAPSMERTGYVYNGNRFYNFPEYESNLWVQGLYGNSSTSNNSLDLDTTGIAVGFDGHVTESIRLGLGYAYTKADGNASLRDVDISSNSLMVYGEYNPNRFYANWILAYTHSTYDESKSVFGHAMNDSYDVDTYMAQAMFGQKMGPFVSGDHAYGVLSPEAGLRFIHTKPDGYTDIAGQSVKNESGTSLTAILGANYTIGYAINEDWSWYPKVRLAATYDLMEPNTTSRVSLIDGTLYTVSQDTLSRFGMEVGASVGLSFMEKAEVALEYEGMFRSGYTNHTGVANLKYKF